MRLADLKQSISEMDHGTLQLEVDRIRGQRYYNANRPRTATKSRKKLPSPKKSAQVFIDSLSPEDAAKLLEQLDA